MNNRLFLKMKNKEMNLNNNNKCSIIRSLKNYSMAESNTYIAEQNLVVLSIA